MDQKIDRFDGNISQGKSSEGSGAASISPVGNTPGRGPAPRRPGGKPGLTERQKRVLEYINESIHSRGYPPTLREIGEHMAIRSTNGVNDHLRALEKKGYLERHDLKSRGLRIVDSSWAPQLGDAAAARRADNDNDNFVDVPVLGKVAAGQPILAVENREDTVRVDRFFLGAQRDVFALRVKGDSMIEAGIFDGDYLFVKKQPTAHSGDIVVAMINEEATVKYFYPESERIVFKPGNSRMHPIEVKKSEFKPVNLLGTVVGVYRKMC